MTTLTQRSEVPPVERDLWVRVVVSREPDHVVDVFRRSVYAVHQTVLAERMLLQVALAAGQPCPRLVKRFRDASHRVAYATKKAPRSSRSELLSVLDFFRKDGIEVSFHLAHDIIIPCQKCYRAPFRPFRRKKSKYF